MVANLLCCADGLSDVFVIGFFFFECELLDVGHDDNEDEYSSVACFAKEMSDVTLVSKELSALHKLLLILNLLDILIKYL